MDKVRKKVENFARQKCRARAQNFNAIKRKTVGAIVVAVEEVEEVER